jgi:hypothetical protein
MERMMQSKFFSLPKDIRYKIYSECDYLEMQQFKIACRFIRDDVKNFMQEQFFFCIGSQSIQYAKSSRYTSSMPIDMTPEILLEYLKNEFDSVDPCGDNINAYFSIETAKAIAATKIIITNDEKRTYPIILAKFKKMILKPVVICNAVNLRLQNDVTEDKCYLIHLKDGKILIGYKNHECSYQETDLIHYHSCLQSLMSLYEVDRLELLTKTLAQLIPAEKQAIKCSGQQLLLSLEEIVAYMGGNTIIVKKENLPAYIQGQLPCVSLYKPQLIPCGIMLLDQEYDVFRYIPIRGVKGAFWTFDYNKLLQDTHEQKPSRCVIG